ncbi:cysteine--tRNA ligase [Candidatus Bodocaedibacter vickermanii]|uniref:Cysteine--tRNA ligase n=1 Tax=Candidatus Bodocaedibacter vickermanii TaxID=2741701 RepID=A0A7L9RUW2_9PROT|nr:Cysteine--tRNA ligase [Candidatus Paracaedibacteraceae bacterium 'Lake Konstanz']
MTVQLYNTRTRTKTAFSPIDPAHIQMYVCGPTVYAPPHIGNGRPVVVFDLLFRLLQAVYPKVTYVRNITDVDDKINQRALETGRSIQDITTETTEYFHETCVYLGAVSPTVEPRVTGHIPEIIQMIQTLVDKGFAYEKEGHVLYRVHRFADYGQLSRKNQDELLAGARVEVAPYKENAEDFVLWKPSTAPTPGWESPFGYGRPGWHIECSAMSSKHLGETFDIHGGGIDLVFPHHENEIAQSTACHDAPMANVWMHNGHLSVNGQKMSKSVGNVIIIQDLMHTLNGQIVRWGLLSSQYRQPLDWTQELVQNSHAALNRLYTALETLSDELWTPLSIDYQNIDTVVLSALQDDLNTPAAFARLHELVHAINTAVNAQDKFQLQTILLNTARFMGFLTVSANEWFRGALSIDAISESEIQDYLDQRQAAKLAKDFKTADDIRDTLRSKGVIIKDTPTGQEWQRAN